MIAKLIDLAKTIRDAKSEGKDLGLSAEEVAFYDALAENGSAREVMKSDALRLMARELERASARRSDAVVGEASAASLPKQAMRCIADAGRRRRARPQPDRDATNRGSTL